MKLDRSTSIYLDALRIAAAVAVALSHLSWGKISGGFLWFIQPYGHDAVVVFFVLSGYVISFTAAAKDKSLRDYAVSRLARLYSVILPALLLTGIADTIGQALGGTAYVHAEETHPVLRLLCAALFLSHTWQHSLTVLSNHAYWSMPYEFWYYALFGSAFYLRGRIRVVAIAASAAIAGPNILMMFPIWLAGVAANRFSERFIVPPVLARILFVATLLALPALAVWADGFGAVQRHYSDDWPPGFAAFDYGLGAVLAVNIIAARWAGLRFGRTEKPIRVAAGFTFSTYLFHLPLLHFAAAVLPVSLPVPVRGAIMLITVGFAVVGLGLVTEHRKDKARSVIERIATRMSTIRTRYPQGATPEVSAPVPAGDRPSPGVASE
ncbi:MAG: acyltransferase [Methanobacterium sp.]|nr:acyltransferase [Methanobacterium sp.]